MKKKYGRKDYLFRNQFKDFLLLRFVFVFILISTQVYVSNAQNGALKAITGKVISSEDNKSIPGATVSVKGTRKGNITDVDGNYSIEAGDGDVLVFSFIGYKTQEIAVSGRSKVDVTLIEDIAILKEVVVVGYGQMKRTDISSAQTTIKAEDIQKTVNTTIDQAIQGRAAGVYVTQNTGQPGGGISVNIRGVNSINGSNEPLYVIDGVQIQPETVAYGAQSSINPLAGINPSDIETMEILQGPSATAIYGSRGTNGVVLIKTKRGRPGEIKVNYGYLYSVQDKPNTLSTMNLREYAQMYAQIRAITGGSIPAEFQDPSVLGEGTNWQDALFKRAPLNKHSLGISGGSEKTQFFLSGEYFNQDGVAIGSNFKRYSARLNVDNQTRKWLKLSTNISLSQTNEALTATQENVISNALTLSPNIPVKNPNGTWGGADATNGMSVQFAPLNPVAIASLIQNNNKRSQALGGFNVDINLLKGLVFTTNINGNVGFNSTTYFTPTWRLGNKTNDLASLSSSNGYNTNWNWNQLLRYNTDIGKHSIGLMVSHEAQESYRQGISANRQGFVTNDIPDLNIGNSQGGTNSGGRGHWAMESYFGRANYSFNNKYIVQGAIRADGSANFGPDNRWGVFPSVSAAWRVSQESFMKAVPFISELKLRVETGITGNQGNGGKIFGPLSSPSVSTPWGGGFILTQYGNSGLKWEETKTNNIGFNLNILQNRIQLEGDFYIKKTSNLLMTNPLPDYMGTAGEGSIGAPTVNIGALENRGYGITLNTINIDRGGFKWTTNFNVSGFKTKITKFYSDAAFIDRSSWYMSGWTQRSIIGESPWLFRGYIQEGIFQSVDEINNSAIPADNKGDRLPVSQNSVWVGDIKYKDLNGDNIIDERDQTFIGNPWPKFSFGFTNTFSFKGFDLNVLLTGAYGNKVFNYLRFTNTNPNNINLGRNLLKESFDYARVSIDADGNPYLLNPDTKIPRISGSDINGNGKRFTDKFVEDGSYIRVKNVQLGYSVPKSLLAKQPVVQGLRIAVGVQNLGTFTKYKGYDPEVGAYVGREVQISSQSIGVDYGRYPLTRVYTLSVGVDF